MFTNLYSNWRKSALGGALNRSPQHSILAGKMECGDGSRIFSRPYGRREDRALGSLVAGRVAQNDRARVWHRGKELADHRRFTLATNINVDFCDPQSPWQRGSNENTNGLLRQYFPKGTDLSVYSQPHLNKVACQLNERPRRTLGFETPAERFNICVASTG